MSDGEFSNNCSRINKSFILLASSSFCGNGPISSASIHWSTYLVDIDSYLHTFEKLAEEYEWPKETWALRLAALLAGKALEAYARKNVDILKFSPNYLR
jgi:hypothetical protein